MRAERLAVEQGSNSACSGYNFLSPRALQARAKAGRIPGAQLSSSPSPQAQKDRAGVVEHFQQDLGHLCGSVGCQLPLGETSAGLRLRGMHACGATTGLMVEQPRAFFFFVCNLGS